ncbi:MAG: hypothetical protein LLG37_01655 [Spirochaetia bacterium]|nr:hypothetical protein [Spirochaetia bacterium]
MKYPYAKKFLGSIVNTMPGPTDGMAFLDREFYWAMAGDDEELCIRLVAAGAETPARGRGQH